MKVYINDFKWERYISTQYTGQLYQDTVDGIVTIGHNRQDRQLHNDNVDLIIMLGHTREDSSIMTQQTRCLHWDTVVRTIILGHSRWQNYTRTLQVAQLHQAQLTGQLNKNTVDGIIMLGVNHLVSILLKEVLK